MSKSTPLSQLPKNHSHVVNKSNDMSNNSKPIVNDDDDDDINIEEVLQQETLTNNNILSLQQQIESLKQDLENKTTVNTTTPLNDNNIKTNTNENSNQSGPTTPTESCSMINKDSLYSVFRHLKRINITSMLIVFIIVLIAYSEYVNDLILMKLGDTRYSVGIPYVKALFVAILFGFFQGL
jgi:regulator of replication initiation timing